MVFISENEEKKESKMAQRVLLSLENNWLNYALGGLLIFLMGVAVFGGFRLYRISQPPAVLPPEEPTTPSPVVPEEFQFDPTDLPLTPETSQVCMLDLVIEVPTPTPTPTGTLPPTPTPTPTPTNTPTPTSPPTGTPSPTLTPTPTSMPLACLLLEPDPDPLTLSSGDQVSLTCTGSSDPSLPIDHAEFRVIRDLGGTDDLGSVPAVKIGDNWQASTTYTIPEQDCYLVQCRVCVSTDSSYCTVWGKAN